MKRIIHPSAIQCQFDFDSLSFLPIPDNAEISLVITPMPETQGYWWSELEHKCIPKSSGIYAIINTTNEHFYIGSAVNLYNRKSEHFSVLRNNKHHSRYLQRAYNHYGAGAFRFVIVEHVEFAEDLIKREQHYIDSLCPEYNIARIAGSALGIKRSNEHKAKTSAASKGRNKGKPCSEERKANISSAKKGNPISERHKAHMSALHAAQKGKPLSEEHKESLSAAHKGHEVSEATRKNISESLKGKSNGKGRKRKPFSEEHRMKLSEAHRGKALSDEHKAKISEALMGHGVSEITKDKIRESKKGNKRGPVMKRQRQI